MPAERPQKSAEGREIVGEGHGKKSAAVREQAILALLTERTLPKAAARCGVSERTLRRWQAEDSSFKAELESARAATFQAGIGRIHTLVAEAINTLEDLLGATESPSVRLGAARTIAEIGIHQ